MRRKLWLTIGTLLVTAGCGGSPAPSPTSPTGTTTTTTPPPPATGVTATGWQGAITATRRTQNGVLDTTQTFEGAVNFEPGAIGDYSPPDLLQPLVPSDATVYVLRPGLLKLTHSGTIGPCSYGSGSWDVLMKKSDGFIAVRPNGALMGRITLPDTSFPITVTCPTGSAPGNTGVQMDLSVNGTVTNSTATGTMTPVTYAGSTFSGTWSFAAR